MVAMSKPNWNPGRRHGTHTTLLPENLAGELLTIGRGGDRDPGIGMQMIHMRRIHQTMHRGINARGGAALAVQAEIERRDHLILPIHPRIHLHQGPHPIQPQHRQTGRFQRAQITAGALHPQQLHRLPGHRIGLEPLAEVFPPA